MWSGRRGGARRVTRAPRHRRSGTGRNAAAGIRRPMSKDHQGTQAVESIVVGGVAARLRGDLPLDDQIGALEPAAGVVEQVAEHRSRRAEGERAQRPERTAWHLIAERVAAHDRDVRAPRCCASAAGVPPSAGPVPAR